jgi:hypothetical protein
MRSREYDSTTHLKLRGTGWWGAPWGLNLPAAEIKENVPGHGCVTCCSSLNDCEQCTQVVDAAKHEDSFSVFCKVHWHHYQMEEGCQCGLCRKERDANGAKQADEADVEPGRRYVAFVERTSKLPPEELTPPRVDEIAKEMGLPRNPHFK